MNAHPILVNFILFNFVAISAALGCQEVAAPDSTLVTSAFESSQVELEDRLKLAEGNRVEIEKALREAPEEHQKAIRFLIRNMRRADLQTLTADFILEDVRLAYEARASYPWASQVPESVFINDVLPFANLDEKREEWRAKLAEICKPIVKDCTTTEQAAQAINQHLFKIVKVKYSRKRKKAKQSPSESIEQGLASCTGLAILLVDACRSVGVPARVVSVLSWTNRRGNHTWVEIWSESGWHFTGAAEYDPAGLNRGWFNGAAALADKTNRTHSIYAVSFARTDETLPFVRSKDSENAVYAVNVTDRYTKNNDKKVKVDKDQVIVRIRVWNPGKTNRVEMPVQVRLASDDSSIGKGKSTGDQADMNNMFEVTLKQNTDYEIRLGQGDQIQTHKITTDATETQLVEIELTP